MSKRPESIELDAHLLFSNLISDIHIASDPVYWTNTERDEFLSIVKDGSAKDMLAFLLAVKTEDVDEYVVRSGQDRSDSEGLPYWMTRFKPSYARYEQIVSSLPDTPEPTEAIPELDAPDYELALIEEEPEELIFLPPTKDTQTDAS